MPEERPEDRDDTAPRPDETRPMPPAEATEAQRNQPSGGPRSDDGDDSVWAGRAVVRPPRRGDPDYNEADWADFGPAQQESRWWTPIAVGVAALSLLALLGFGIAVIVQNSGGGTEAPAPTPTARTVTDGETAPKAPPPTVIETVSVLPTTEPVDTEVLVPALRGMPLADARAALERTGLTSRVIRRSSDAEPGTVIDSDPPEGRLVPSDTRITLVVAAESTAEPSPPSAPTTTPSGG
ncbi:PASTA domain-containing protein [Actinoplanes sp. NBC_00393]|uniref:Stk1 family PASTA domain-containing Ser/Thr kinase n=1 Tax=Actinoplanes sp. NBC_00393 TaxID=2975953 RepID=UPI002E1D2018